MCKEGDIKIKKIIYWVDKNFINFKGVTTLNMLKEPGSSLGYKHIEESLKLMSEKESLIQCMIKHNHNKVYIRRK